MGRTYGYRHMPTTTTAGTKKEVSSIPLTIPELGAVNKDTQKAAMPVDATTVVSFDSSNGELPPEAKDLLVSVLDKQKVETE